MVREIATAVDWPCKVETNFRSKNLGCRLSEAQGMDWFFEHEEKGIILEDDTLPLSGFFRFCEELLDLYGENEQVFSISGNSYFGERFKFAESYIFSQYADYWAWAGWRRSWRSYDVNMRDWPGWRDVGGLKNISGGDRLFERYWQDTFDSTHAGLINTWDYQRLFTMWQYNGVSILPTRNMVMNIGFGPGATHTKAPPPRWLSEQKPRPPTFPLIHPKQVRTIKAFDSYFGSRIFGINRIGVLKRHLSKSQFARRVRDWMLQAQ